MHKRSKTRDSKKEREILKRGQIEVEIKHFSHMSFSKVAPFSRKENKKMKRKNWRAQVFFKSIK